MVLPIRVLVSRRLFPEAILALRQQVDVSYHDSQDGLPRDELVAALSGHQVLVCPLTERIDAAVIDAAADLRLIANVAVGYDNIDLAAATRRGITVTNTPGVLTQSTADLTFALLMATARRLGEAERLLRAGAWRQWQIDLMAGQDVFGQPLGILGMGRIGQAVARRARGFGMPVLYHNRRRLDSATEVELGARYVEFAELLESVTFLSVHLPLNAKTRGMLATAELAAMRQGAILINTARGPVVDTDALVAALASGHLGGAGLDVFDDEPHVDRRLLQLENAVLLPHIGSASRATRGRMCMLAVDNVLAFAAGRPVPHAVNPVS